MVGARRDYVLQNQRKTPDMNPEKVLKMPLHGTRNLILCLAATGALVIAPSLGLAQSSNTAGNQASIKSSPNEAEKHTWKIDQLIPLTVAQAWQLSGKNEDRFFDMVQDLAALSAQNRDLVLPQTEAAGRQAGEYIKQEAQKDHQQLLYVVVDRAVRKVGKPASSANASTTK